MSATRHRISFVLPAYNEEDNIGPAVDSVTEVGQRLFRDHEVIVVDDGSTDTTARLVAGMRREDDRVRLVQHPRNRGYGEALRSGFKAAGMELVFVVDADNQFDVWELARFLPWIERVDVVAGYRVNRRDTLFRRLLAHGWNLLVRLLFHVPVRDIDCAFKLFRRSVFEVVDLEAVGAMVNTELMVKIGRAGLGVVELGVHHYPREHGEPRGAHPWVVLTALRELFAMRQHLSQLEASELPRGVLPARPMRREGDEEEADETDPGPQRTVAVTDGEPA